MVPKWPEGKKVEVWASVGKRTMSGLAHGHGKGRAFSIRRGWKGRVNSNAAAARNWARGGRGSLCGELQYRDLLLAMGLVNATEVRLRFERPLLVIGDIPELPAANW